MKTILGPLVEQYKKHKIQGFILYSNNANLYALEYAGRAIENMFDTPHLFIKYLDRNHEERIHDRPDHSGYASKLVKTIRQYTTQKAPILFVDDLVHNDFYIDYENVTYIIIPAFEGTVNNNDLQYVFTIFEEKIFNTLNDDEKTLFFNLYHIKHILQLNSIDDIKRYYLEYSKERKAPKPFKEDMPMIEDKIKSFIKKISTYGGKRKTKRNCKRRYTKKRKI